MKQAVIRSLGYNLEMVARLKQVRSRKPVGGESSGKSDPEIKRWPAMGEEGGVSPGDTGLVMKCSHNKVHEHKC